MNQLLFFIANVVFIVFAVIYQNFIVIPCMDAVANFNCGQYILPDSNLYMMLSVQTNSLFEYRWNVIGISYFYSVIDTYFDYFTFSCILVLSANIVLFKALKYLNLVSGRKVIFLCLFVMNPQTIYYVQSPTKEIFLYFLSCLILFFISMNNFNLFKLISFSSVTTFLRIQSGLSLFSSFIASFLPKKTRVRLVSFVFLCFCSLLPLLYSLSIFNTYLNAGEDYLAAETTGAGIGVFIRNIEQSTLFVGSVTVPIKIFQNIIDPFPLSFLYIKGSVNFYSIKDILAFFMLGYIVLFSFFWFMKINFFRFRPGLSYKYSSLVFVIITVSFLFVGLNTFIHGRYLYPSMPFFLVCFLDSKMDNGVQENRSNRSTRKISAYTWGVISLYLLQRSISQI